MHWWQSIEEASVAFENIQYQCAISFTSPVWKDAFLLIYSHLYTWLHAWVNIKVRFGIWPKYFLLLEIIQRQTRNLGTQEAARTKGSAGGKNIITPSPSLTRLNLPLCQRMAQASQSSFKSHWKVAVMSTGASQVFTDDWVLSCYPGCHPTVGNRFATVTIALERPKWILKN